MISCEQSLGKTRTARGSLSSAKTASELSHTLAGQLESDCSAQGFPPW